MPYWNFRGSRESNTLNSEVYKDQISRYFQALGYIKLANSAIQGCLSDLIFKNRDIDGNIETHVEAKWDTFSLNNKDIRQEFDKYLFLFLRLPRSQRFHFFIFARNISNPTYHRKIFEKLVEESIHDLRQKIQSDLTGDDSIYFQSISDEDFKEFIGSTSIIQTDIEGLRIRITQILGEYPDANDPFQRYAGLIEKYNIIEKPELVLGNLVEICNFNSVWSAGSSFTTYDEINRNVQYPLPYTLYEKNIISLTKFTSDNPLKPIIDPLSINEISTIEWTEDEDKRRVLISLLNSSIIKLCQLRGLFKVPERRIFYFPLIATKIETSNPEPENKEDQEKIEKEEINPEYPPLLIKKWRKDRLYERNVISLYNADGAHPYHFHQGIEINATFLDDRFYYGFLPRKVFTEDGRNVVDSERAYHLETFFRNPLMSRNRNLLNDQAFWLYTLTKDPTIQTHTLFENDVERAKKRDTRKLLKCLGLQEILQLNSPITPVEKSNE